MNASELPSGMQNCEGLEMRQRWDFSTWPAQTWIKVTIACYYNSVGSYWPFSFLPKNNMFYISSLLWSVLMWDMNHSNLILPKKSQLLFQIYKQRCKVVLVLGKAITFSNSAFDYYSNVKINDQYLSRVSLFPLPKLTNGILRLALYQACIQT